MSESQNGQLLVSEDLYTSLITNSKFDGLNMFFEFSIPLLGTGCGCNTVMVVIL